MRLLTLKSILAIFVLSLVAVSCGKEKIDNTGTEFRKVSDYPNDVVHEWNEVFLQIERYAAGYRPGPAPRAVAYIGLAAYESVVPGMPEFNSFDQYWAGFDIPEIEADKEYCWPVVINASYEYLLPRFFGKAT